MAAVPTEAVLMADLLFMIKMMIKWFFMPQRYYFFVQTNITRENFQGKRI